MRDARLVAWGGRVRSICLMLLWRCPFRVLASYDGRPCKDWLLIEGI